MVELDLSIGSSLVAAAVPRHERDKKKADVAEHAKVFDYVGLLVNGLPGTSGSPFI
jgi:hypothetical protein